MRLPVTGSKVYVFVEHTAIVPAGCSRFRRKRASGAGDSQGVLDRLVGWGRVYNRSWDPALYQLRWGGLEVPASWGRCSQSKVQHGTLEVGMELTMTIGSHRSWGGTRKSSVRSRRELEVPACGRISRPVDAQPSSGSRVRPDRSKQTAWWVWNSHGFSVVPWLEIKRVNCR